jgi:hypothetical protein
MQHTLPEAAEHLDAVAAVTDKKVAVIDEVVADKGHHSRTSVLDLERKVRSRGHRLPSAHRVTAKPILGGLHHEYGLEALAA